MDTDSIVMRAHRTLRHLKRYKHFSGEGDKLPVYLAEVPLRPSEVVIGVYENFPNEIRESIVLTNLGLYIFLRGEWERINYSEIVEIETPSEKHTAREIVLNTMSGRASLPVTGGESKFRDAFEFMHFLMRVIEK